MEILRKANLLVRRLLMARGASSGVVTVKGHPVHYYRLEGFRPGTPVVLLHGLGGQANGFFRTFFALARRFGPVIALDLPGHGFSPSPANGPLPMVQQVEVLGAFLDEVVGSPVFLVGNSLGGAMAIRLAHASPSRVKALGLVAPAGAMASAEEFAATVKVLTVTSDREARALTRRLFHRVPLTMLLLAGEMRKMYSTPAVRQVFAETKHSDYITPEILGSLGMPTLLLWGASERLLPYRGIEYFREHLPPHAEVEVVQGFGHIPQMEKPRELVRKLSGFADRHGL